MPFEHHPTVKVKACNLCGAERFSPITNRDRYGLPVTVVRCEECGLRFINPRMTDAEYLEFYRDGTYRRLLEELTGQSLAPEAVEKDQEGYSRMVVERLRPHVNGHRTLLDVGGSTGGVAATFRDAFDMEATVLEPSDEEADRAEMRCLPVLRCGLADLDPGEVFDVVLLCRSVEHLTDISGALERIRQLLTPGGLFFVDIAKGSRAKVDHCYYLDMGTMLAYLEKAGFKDIDARSELGNNPPRVRRITFVAKR